MKICCGLVGVCITHSHKYRIQSVSKYFHHERFAYITNLYTESLSAVHFQYPHERATLSNFCDNISIIWLIFASIFWMSWLSSMKTRDFVCAWIRAILIYARIMRVIRSMILFCSRYQSAEFSEVLSHWIFSER